MSMFPKRFVGSTYINSLLLVSTLLLLMPNSFGVLASTKSSTASNTERSSRGRPSSHPNAGKQCPFFDGIYTSVMRRIFNQGFHKYVVLFS